MLKFTIFTKLRAQYQTIHDYICNWSVISDLKYISIHQWRLAYFNTLSYMTRSHKGVTHGNIYKKTWYCTILRDTYSLSKLSQYKSYTTALRQTTTNVNKLENSITDVEKIQYQNISGVAKLKLQTWELKIQHVILTYLTVLARSQLPIL